jgi:hypothetical protein
MAATILTAGCGKPSTPSGGAVAPPADTTAIPATPISQPALTAWRQGDKAGAVAGFLAADWSAHPLFAADSALSLSESQFKALSDADRQAKSTELTTQLGVFKQLAAAVTQAGQEAAAKGDPAQARKCFTALKQCGAALAGPDSSSLVQLVGQALSKRADTELGKLPQ